MQVVSLVSLGGRRNRYEVNLDDGSSIELAGIIAISLYVGQQLTADDLRALEESSLQEEAYEKVLYYLSFRQRSEMEIEKYLAGKHLEATSAAVIARLKRAGLVDDTEFARHWVENRNTFHPRGSWALRAELRRAGIDKDIVEQAVASVDEEQNAVGAAERKAWQLRALDEQVFRTKLLAFLQRRGFGYQVANRTVQQLWKQTRTEEPDAPEGFTTNMTDERN